jgi:hypothetical protein
MIARTAGLAVAILSLSMLCLGQQADVPPGFHWVDFKRGDDAVAKVEKGLAREDYTAIREIGVSGDFALVFTSNRESGQSTPRGDGWSVYNISLKTGKSRLLLAGYKLEVGGWLRLQSSGMPDLAVSYLNCWECEAVSIFTALHCDPESGWRARWRNEKSPILPGVGFLDTDVGDPYTNEDVDQIFAVLAPEGTATVGTWYHSRDLKTGKITSEVNRYFVDPKAGTDKSVTLRGAGVVPFEVRLCKGEYALPGLFQGQSSPSCKRVLSKSKGKAAGR